MKNISSLLIVSLLLFLMPVNALSEFPITTKQLGEHGKKGRGGLGGEGGAGGAGGIATATGADRNGKPGQMGDVPPTIANFGGKGGSGTWTLRNMAPGDAFINQGTLIIGGSYGLPGKKGKIPAKGGDGGAGGGILCVPAAVKGSEPSPDPDPGTQQGGVAGTVTSEGGSGTDGGGGGGGRCSAPFVGGGNGGKGGKGKKGEDGASQAPDAGTNGGYQSTELTISFTNQPGETLQIGGNGGEGGNQGQPGGGGGGGGGAGESWGKARGSGGQGNDQSYQYGIEVAGGMYGGGYVYIEDDGRLINQGLIRLSINCGYEWGYCINSWISVESGGFLKNSETGEIIIKKNGSLSAYYADSTIVNNGLIDNYYSSSFDGYYRGSGTINGSVTFYGYFMPGDPIGFHTINESYFQEEGRLQIEISGKDHIDPEYDYVAVFGDYVSFGEDSGGNPLSSLELIFVSGFTEDDLLHGDYFDIIRYPPTSTRSGVFASIDDTQAPLSHGMWSLSYDEYVDADTISVRLTYHSYCRLCDFEPAAGDLDVDGADLAVYIAEQAGISLNDFAAEFGRTNCPF